MPTKFLRESDWQNRDAVMRVNCRVLLSRKIALPRHHYNYNNDDDDDDDDAAATGEEMEMEDQCGCESETDDVLGIMSHQLLHIMSHVQNIFTIF